MTGAPVYIVHLSCREALEEAIRARLRGVQVWVETLIQYLLLDKSHAELPGFEGAKYVMSPPLRDKKNQEVLWNGLKQGLVNTVGTDHAPFDFSAQKPMGRDDFTKIPNGIPALEDRINLLFTYGVKTGRLDLHTFVNVASTNAAKIFNLFPRKGAIQPGSDADLVIYDPNYRGKLSAADAPHEHRLQRLRRMAHRRPTGGRHCPRRCRRARRKIRGRSGTRPLPAAQHRVNWGAYAFPRVLAGVSPANRFSHDDHSLLCARRNAEHYTLDVACFPTP